MTSLYYDCFAGIRQGKILAASGQLEIRVQTICWIDSVFIRSMNNEKLARTQLHVGERPLV